MHCGFCNSTCPTYSLLGDELDGPRGRIYLIKGLLEGEKDATIASTHLDRCLTCRACEASCPSGVEYGELVEIGRSVARSELSRFLRLLLSVLTRASFFRFLVSIGRIFRWLLPDNISHVLRNKPAKQLALNNAPVSFESSASEVVVLRGCIQDAMTPDVAGHIVNLLHSKGVNARLGATGQCCGGLHLHEGQIEEARDYMASLAGSFSESTLTTILSSGSGCGVTLKEYGRLLNTDKGRFIAENTKAVEDYLSQFTFSRKFDYERVAWQAPCTLQHGQRIVGVVEKILQQAGYELVTVPDGGLCCGSAGTYSIRQEQLATELRKRKLDSLMSHDPQVVATANVGCKLHLAPDLPVPMMHWTQLLQ